MVTNEVWQKSLEELGEAAVEAKLAEGFFGPPVNLVAREWLYHRRMERETIQRERELCYIRRTAHASWALAIITLVLVGITFLGIWWQKVDNREQREQAKEQLENANNLSRAVFGGFMVTPQPVLGRIAVD